MLLKKRIKIVLESFTKKGYLRWYLKAYLGERIRWKGIQLLKFVPDLWNYQEIITEHQIINVIEFGSFRGGAAVFFADMLRLNNTNGKVLAVDIEDRWDAKTNRPDIMKLVASTTSDLCRDTIKKFREENQGKVFVIIDSEHTGKHVYNELKLITPLLETGDYVVVEDTVFNSDEMQGVRKFFSENMDQYIHDRERENKFGVTLAKYGYWVKQ